MSHCCEEAACEADKLQARQRWVLWTVLVVNAAMFGVEVIAGWLAASTALLADAADMLGDASVYAVSLLAVSRGPVWKARAATLKGAVMVAFAVLVLAQALWRALDPTLPHAGTMGAVGALALAANLLCFGLLWRSRGDDVNMRSVWLCSRNDLFANVAVLASAAAVALLGSRWPDLLVGAAIAGLFLHSALDVFRDARASLRDPLPVGS
ncbi:MAG: cation transporter [Pseudomonadales bacterium]|nr:cation transporter [Pseudomonadales bacterium]